MLNSMAVSAEHVTLGKLSQDALLAPAFLRHLRYLDILALTLTDEAVVGMIGHGGTSRHVSAASAAVREVQRTGRYDTAGVKTRGFLGQFLTLGLKHKVNCCHQALCRQIEGNEELIAKFLEILAVFS